ncbi:hypothetical protein MBAV_006427 [Candidatus Magnetobacterium bavaricum]|uniref:Uncharacterized protein n=1 Tax=Candidatus Magnetobacterium bavaricum TaxID=29290 RepID=A0A0F3GL32_9BACT|nr:hypothetical protein MBAV_006427 [Candidatus Magnetobacterium bavaricum]
MASSTPATSLNVTLLVLSDTRRALDLPKDMALLPPICICLMKNIQISARNIIGPHEKKKFTYHGLGVGGLTVIFTPLVRSSFIRSGYSMA